MIAAELISKEEILRYKFIHAPVSQAKELFVDKLKGALRLGNAFKAKINLVFNTTEGPKKVETTVWNVSPDFVELKGGVIIPVQSILEVEY